MTEANKGIPASGNGTGKPQAGTQLPGSLIAGLSEEMLPTVLDDSIEPRPTKWGAKLQPVAQPIRSKDQPTQAVREIDQTTDKATKFVLPEDDEWTHYAAMATIIHQHELMQAMYTAAALSRSDLPGDVHEKLLQAFDQVAQKGDGRNLVIEEKVWKDIGLTMLNPLFEELAPHVKEIASIQKRNETFQANDRKGSDLKKQVARDCEQEIATIRREKLAPALLAHMRKHYLVDVGLTDEVMLHDLQEFSADIVEKLVTSFCLSPDKDKIKPALERYIREEPAQPGDEQVLAQHQPASGQPLLQELETMVMETGLSIAGPVAEGFLGAKNAMSDYQTYFQQASQSINAEPASRRIMREAAMLKHEEAYEKLKVALERINTVSREITTTNDEPDMKRTELRPGLTKDAAAGLSVLQKGYPDFAKTDHVIERYDQWRQKTNTKRDEEQLTDRGKAATWMRMSKLNLADSNGVLVENRHLLKRCEESLTVLAQAEEAGRKPTQEEFKTAYDSIAMAVPVLRGSKTAMTEIIAGMPVAVPADMKDLEGRLKFRAQQELDFLEKHGKALNELQDALRKPLDSMEQAWLQADGLQKNTQAFFNRLKERHDQWEAYKSKATTAGVAG